LPVCSWRTVVVRVCLVSLRRPSPTDDAAKPKGALGSARSESPIKPTLGPAERLRRTMRAKIMEKDANPTSAMKRLNKVGCPFHMHCGIRASLLWCLHGPDSRGLNLTQFKACMKQVLFGDAKGAAGAGGSRMDQTMTEVQCHCRTACFQWVFPS
jgi:hypothetical protein